MTMPPTLIALRRDGIGGRVFPDAYQIPSRLDRLIPTNRHSPILATSDPLYPIEERYS